MAIYREDGYLRGNVRQICTDSVGHVAIGLVENSSFSCIYALFAYCFSDKGRDKNGG